MRRAALVICVLVGLFPATAQATQRYASPTGSGTACTQATPCELIQALGSAESGDEVIVGGGTYNYGGPLVGAFGATNLYVHGDFGGPMPVISETNGNYVIELPGEGSRLAYLEIRNSAETAQGPGCFAKNGTVERVVSVVSGKNSRGIDLRAQCTVRDSLAIASGENSTALDATTTLPTSSAATVRNVTAIATGPGSAGARSRNMEVLKGTIFTLDLKNSILSGEGADISAEQAGVADTTDVAVAHSNFDAPRASGTAHVIDGGGNQTAPPLFVNAAAGNYREAAGSPTIDAGVADLLGAVDLAGSPRVLGGAPDIGAYEYVPAPIVCCAAPGGVRSISIKPRKFRAAKKGGPVAQKIGHGKPPVGAKVTFTMSGPATVEFSVSRRTRKKCGSKAPRKCRVYKPVKGSFTRSATAGTNHFVFSGRIGGHALKPGSYKLTAFAGHLVSARFKIVR